MRTDKAIATTLARSFLLSNTATLWLYVTNDVRSALVDQIVMGHIIVADVVEKNRDLMTPGDVVAFRNLVIMALARGVRRNGGLIRCVLGDEA